MSEEITITGTLSGHQQREAAGLFFSSFRSKFGALWLFTREPGKAVEVLSRSINFDKGLYAIKGGELVGFIGLETGGSRYTELGLSVLTKTFGPWGGLWRYAAYLVFRAFRHGAREDEMHIDPIAVSEKARGLGVGTRLLDESFMLAKASGKRKLTLEVVDANPGARRLYERKGFVVTRILKTGLLTARAGFGKVLFMEKEIV